MIISQRSGYHQAEFGVIKHQGADVIFTVVFDYPMTVFCCSVACGYVLQSSDLAPTYLRDWPPFLWASLKLQASTAKARRLTKVWVADKWKRHVSTHRLNRRLTIRVTVNAVSLPFFRNVEQTPREQQACAVNLA